MGNKYKYLTIFLIQGLLLLSLSLVSCRQKNNSSGEDNYSKASTSQSVGSTQSSGEESIKTISPAVENAVESKEKDEDVQKNTQQDTQQEVTEDEYYRIIKEAWQKQKDYIDSIDDPKEKQSVQTSHSAAIMESNRLLIEHPEDSEAIEGSLKRVINGK